MASNFSRLHSICDVYVEASVVNFSVGYGVYFESAPEFSFFVPMTYQFRDEQDKANLGAIDAALDRISQRFLFYDTYRIHTTNATALRAIFGSPACPSTFSILNSIRNHLAGLDSRYIRVSFELVYSCVSRGNFIAEKLARSGRLGLPIGEHSVSVYVSKLEENYRRYY